MPLLVSCFLARTRPLLCPGDPCGPARASRPCRECQPARPALPLAGRVLAPASGYGHLTRPRPQDSAIFIASRWPAQESPAGKRRLQRGQLCDLWPVLGHPRASTLQVRHASGFCGQCTGFTAMPSHAPRTCAAFRHHGCHRKAPPRGRGHWMEPIKRGGCCPGQSLLAR